VSSELHRKLEKELPNFKSYGMHSGGAGMPKEGDLVICPYTGVYNYSNRLAVITGVMISIPSHREHVEFVDVFSLQVKFLDNGQETSREPKYWKFVQ